MENRSDHKMKYQLSVVVVIPATRKLSEIIVLLISVKCVYDKMTKCEMYEKHFTNNEMRSRETTVFLPPSENKCVFHVKTSRKSLSHKIHIAA